MILFVSMKTPGLEKHIYSMMTIMVYVYCPLSVVMSHHFLPSCTQSDVWLNDVTLRQGCYLAVKIVSNILKKAKGQKFEKE